MLKTGASLRNARRNLLAAGGNVRQALETTIRHQTKGRK
jgi:hypothetical protein